MKKYLLIIGIIFAAITALSLYYLPSNQHYPKDQTIDIALVSNSSDDINQNMIDGANLCVNTINKNGGLFGKKIQLHVFDDIGKSRKATQIATKISNSNQILLVLGHSNDNCSIAAGRTYKKIGIPVIAASATSELVTLDNEWYFRIIPNDEFQAKFIAHYVYRSLKMTSAGIIHDNDDFGKITSASFEAEARKIGLDVKKKWNFDTNSKTLTQDLKQILHALRSSGDIEILFLATDESFASQIISSVHYPRTKLQIIGTFNLTHPSFLKKMKKQLMEQKNPGYFSNGIHVIIPYMPELSDTDGMQFLKNFLKTYHRQPTWYAASYYDATMVAIEAIKKAGIHDAAIGKKRMDIKDALQSMYHSDYAVKGAMGYHFFNHHGDIQTAVKVGSFLKQNIYPEFSEYDLDITKKHDPDMSKKILNGDKMIIDELVMNKTQVVYTGISVNQIRDLDTVKQTCTYDFFIWFRYKGSFDPKNIIFENAVQPVQLDKPIIEKKGDMTICSFHIACAFKQDFNFRAYPFDQQQLTINYRHKTLTDNHLKLVVDKTYHPLSPDKQKIDHQKLNTISGWELKGEYLYPDIETLELKTGFTQSSGINRDVSYSLINYKACIKRVHLSGVFRHFIPILALNLLSCIVLFLPYQRIVSKVIVLSAIVIANAIYHINIYMALDKTYITVLEYCYIGFYFVLIYIVLTSVLMYYFHTQRSPKITKVVSILLKSIYFILVAGLGYLTYYFISMNHLTETWWNYYHI